MNVLLYTTETCFFCTMAKKLLSNSNISYKEIHIDHNFILFEKIIKLTNQKTVPQIFINGIFIGGYTELNSLIEKQIKHN